MNKIIEFLKKILKVIIIFILYLLLPSLIYTLLYHIDFTNNKLILNLISNSFTVIVLILIFLKDLKKELKDFKKNYKSYLKTTIKYWLIGIVVMVVSNLIINFFVFDGSISGNEEAVRGILLTSPLLGLLLSGIIAPLAEELTFRKNFRILFKNVWAFAFVTTFIFAGLHVITDFSSALDLLYFIPYGALGFAFAFAYYKTNNIFSTILIHGIHNTLVFSLVIIASLGV